MAKEPAEWIDACLHCGLPDCTNCWESRATKQERIAQQIEIIKDFLLVGKPRAEICKTLEISVDTFKRRIKQIEEERQNNASQ